MKNKTVKNHIAGLGLFTSSFLLAIIMLVAAASRVSAVGYTFTNTAAGSDNWSVTANWDANGVPVSSTSASMSFFSGVVTPLGGNITIASDPASLTLNGLTLNGLANPSSNTVVTIGTTGNVWTFDGASPTINLNGLKNSGSNLTVNVSPNLSLNQDLNIAGSGTATFNINGAISGSHNLVKSGTSAVILTGANTYTGNTTVNGGGLTLSGGSISSPNGTINVINGLGTLSSGGSITVNNLILTNNDLVSVTNSLFNFAGGTLTTSNTTWIMPGNGGPTFSGTFNMNAGSHQFVPLVQNGFIIASNCNVNPGATLGLGGALLFKGFVNGNMLVDNGSVTGAVMYLKVGGNTGSSGKSLTITNGGLVQLTPTGLGATVFEVGSGPGASNNWVTVMGTNSAGEPSTLDLNNGRFNIGNSASSAATYKASLIVGSGGLVKNVNLLMWDTNSSVLLTNGGRIVGIVGGSTAFVIGRCPSTTIGGISNVVTVTGSDAAGNPSTIDAIGGECAIGLGLSGQAGANVAYNGLVVANGGVVTNMSYLKLGYNQISRDCENNYAIVSGGGKIYLTISLFMSPQVRQNNNSLKITGAGSLIDLPQVILAQTSFSTNDSITIENGGAMTGVTSILIAGVDSRLILDNGLIRFGTNDFISNIIQTNTPFGNAVNPLVLIRSGGAMIDTPYIGTNVVQLPFTEDPSSVGGGLTKLGAGILALADANTYTGNTVISNGTLQLTTPTTLNTNTSVYLTAGTAIDLSFTGTNVVKDLYINGVRQPQGVYGANPPGITGTGYLQVSVGAPSAPPTLNYTLSGSPGAQSLNFSWTGAFKLQSQTNALNVGLGTNWYDYPGGGSSPVSVPVSSGNASVFFRLAQ